MSGEHVGCRMIEKGLRERIARLEFFLAILLAVSEHRAKSLEVMEDFIANLKRNALDPSGTTDDPNG